MTLQEKIEKLFDIEPAGGLCHMVLGDLNTDDDSIDFCIRCCEINSSEPESMIDLCLEILKDLKECDPDKRDQIIGAASWVSIGI